MEEDHFATLEELWSHSPCYTKMSQVDSSLPNCKIFRVLSSLPRWTFSIFIQLHTGHISLNAFLKKINAVNSALCSKCCQPEATTTLPQALQNLQGTTRQPQNENRKGLPLNPLAFRRSENYPTYPTPHSRHPPLRQIYRHRTPRRLKLL